MNIVNPNGFFFVSNIPLHTKVLSDCGCTFFETLEEMLEYVAETNGYDMEEIEGCELTILSETLCGDGSPAGYEINGSVEEFIINFEI